MHKTAGLLLLMLATTSSATQLDFTKALDDNKITYMYSYTKNEIYIDPSTPIDDATVCTLASKSEIQQPTIIKDFANRSADVKCK